MNAPPTVAVGAWQPFTSRGVAAFATASSSRVFTVQFVAALLVAATAVWFVRQAWLPVLNEAVERLPETGAVRNGEIDWRAPTPQRLAENRFLAIVVDAEGSGQINRIADAQLEVGRSSVRLAWLGAGLRLGYPKGYYIALNRNEMIPFWGAWRPFFVASLAIGLVLLMPVVWWAFASAYALPVWLLGLGQRRQLTLAGSWRLAGAALMPGAAVMCAAVFLYGSELIDLIRLWLLIAIHLPVGWVYAIMATRCLPVRERPSPSKPNPFEPADVPSQTNPFAKASPPVSPGTAPSENPFAGPDIPREEG